MEDGKGRCVILADGHQNILEGIRNLLKTMFETVIMVADRDSLFEAIEKVEPDMAIVDLSLPPADEADIVQTVRDTFPKLQFVILSVHDDSTVIDEVMSAGASGFVLKRSVVVDLFKAIRNVRKGHTFVSTSGKH